MQKKIDIDELLINYLTGNVSDEERMEIHKWINQNDRQRAYFNDLRDLYISSKDDKGNFKRRNKDLTWEKIKVKHYKDLTINLGLINTKLRKSRRVFMYASVIFLFLSAVGIIGISPWNRTQNMMAWYEVEAPRGSLSHVTLADSSVVWLNAGSTIRYSSQFNREDRRVYLEGEAFFDVRKNGNNKFVVETSRGLNIVVYGTKFNVTAYPEDDYLQTILNEGLIVLEGDLVKNAGKERIELSQNQIATFNFDNETVNMNIESTGNPDAYISWKENRWVFDGEELTGLCLKLERRYNVNIHIQSEILKNYKLTGIIEKETLEQVLDAIKISTPIEYRIQNNNVYLSANPIFKSRYNDLVIKNDQSDEE